VGQHQFLRRIPKFPKQVEHYCCAELSALRLSYDRIADYWEVNPLEICLPGGVPRNGEPEQQVNTHGGRIGPICLIPFRK